jgi:predicted outer membrane repeat protein
VTVGNGPDCNFPTLQAAVDSVGAEVDLTVQVQGRDDGDTQGIYPSQLIIGQARTLSIVGDDGAALSTCTAVGATRPPKLVPAVGGAGYMIRIGDQAQVLLDTLEIGDAAQGAIELTAEASLHLRRSVLRGNRSPAGVSGAAVQMDSAQLHISDSLFVDNRSGAAGGAIFCTATAPVLNTITLDGTVQFGAADGPNRAASDGGAIALLRRCELTAHDELLFENNIADRDGGAISTAGQQAVPQDGSEINLVGSGVFEGNFAARNGGALLVASQNELEISGTYAFIDNDATRDGGAIAATGPTLASDSGQVNVESSVFLLNSARRGGAVWIDARRAEFSAQCESRRESLRDQYCASFQLNTALGASPVSAFGGALLATSGAEVSIDGFEFRNNDVVTTGDLRGVGAALAAGGGSLLRVGNSLLWRNGHNDTDGGDRFEGDTTSIELLGAGNHLEMVLSSIVQQAGDEYLRVQPGATAHLVGVIAAENRAGVDGIFDPGGAITGSCNNVHIGPPPPPTDPDFVPAPGTGRGLFRLADTSAMRARCRLSDLGALPHISLSHDMDGIPRAVSGSGNDARVDAGAFTHVATLRVVAACEGNDLRVTVQQGDAQDGLRLGGTGPSLPAFITANSPERAFVLRGPATWTNLVLQEEGGDLERVALADASCGALPQGIFADSFEEEISPP